MTSSVALGHRCPQCGLGQLQTMRISAPSEYSCGHLDTTALLTVDGYAKALEAERRRTRDRVIAIIAEARP